MATITTAQAGLFSASSTWVGGVKPGSGDTADCDHNVTVDENVDGVNWDIAAGITVTVNEDCEVTGQTADVVTGDKTAHIYLNAGASWKFNSAGTRSLALARITARGTASKWCTIDNLGGGVVQSATHGGNYDLEYLDWLHNGFTYANARRVRLRQVNVNGGTYFYTESSLIDFDGVWLSGMLSGFYGTAPAIHRLRNMTCGEDRNGASNPNSRDIYLHGTFHGELFGARLLSPTQIYRQGSTSSLRILDLGRANGEGDPGGYGEWTHYHTLERSTSAKKSADYGARLTPTSNLETATERTWARMRVSIPCQSGDAWSYTGYVRRHLLTSDAVSIVTDPSANWMSAASTHNPDLASADTWVQATDSGTLDAGSDEGTLELEFLVKEYEAGNYVDFADFEITVGSWKYTVDFEAWSISGPVPTSVIAASTLTAPTLTVADQQDGTGATATLTGGDAGATNTIMVSTWPGIVPFAQQGQRVGPGTVDLTLTKGAYLAYCKSGLGDQIAVSAVVPFRVTNSADAKGYITGSVNGLERLVAESEAFQTRVGAGSYAEALGHVYKWLHAGNPLFQQVKRPCACVWTATAADLAQFAASQVISLMGSGALVLYLTDIDRIPEERQASLDDFAGWIDQILLDFKELSALDDRLPIRHVTQLSDFHRSRDWDDAARGGTGYHAIELLVEWK